MINVKRSLRFHTSMATTTARFSSTLTLKSPTPADADAFLSMMNHRKGSVVSDPHILETHNIDQTRQYKGHSRLLLRPRSTSEVSSILKYCNKEKIGIVPQSGNTSLAGGSIAVSDEVILSVKGLDTIYGLDEHSGILTCDAGCVLADLQAHVAARQHAIPYDLGSKGSCCIAGNLSTNAGGQYLHRYGSLHANVLGIEVVLPENGQILNLMRSNLKDNTGYDLKHLFIGAEGTLGVITKVALHCPRAPLARNAAFLACNTYHDVQETLYLAKSILGEVLAAFEFMDQAILDILSTQKQIPVCQESGSNYPYCVLAETHGSNAEHDSAKMQDFLEKAMEQNVVADGVLSQDWKQVQEMWQVRESCNPAVASQGYVYKYDFSLPIEEFEDFIDEIRQRLDGHEATVVNWGHFIDGDLHLNVTTPGVIHVDPVILDKLEPFVFESIIRRGGSISAEHGVGQCRNEYLPLCKDPITLETMQSMKQLFDPNGILNPGKYLPTES